MMVRPIFALSVLLAFFLHPSFVEGQLQVAWKHRQEGNTDNQAFISMNGQTANLPSFLGQMLGGTNPLGDFLALFGGGGRNTGAGFIAPQAAKSPGLSIRAPLATNSTGRTSLTTASSGSGPEEVETDVGHADNGTWLMIPQTIDDRPVPGEVDVGHDGLLYFKGNQSLSLEACKTYCHGFRGFRLAMAKTNETMAALRSHGSVTIDLSIVRHKKTGAVKFVWGDGSELDSSLIRSDWSEPVMNNGATATVLVMYPSGSKIIFNDALPGYALPCLCQGSFGTSMQNVP